MSALAVPEITPVREKRKMSSEMQLTLRLLAFSFFGLGLPRVFTSTAAHTLFIETYGPQLIPYAYLAEALLVPVFGHLYIKADEKFSMRALIAGSMAIDFVVLVALWVGYTFIHAKPIAFFGMVWFETEFVFCSLWLWGMATQLMTLRQGKRLFGYISAGEPTAVILGGMLTPLLLKFLHPQALFLLSAFGVGVGILLVVDITRRFKVQKDGEGGEDEETTEVSGAKKWYSDRYVQVLVGIVIISQFAYFFTDSAFYLEAGARFPEEADLGAFIGKYMAAVGVVSLITSLFVSGPLVKRFGLKSALLLLPIMLVSTAAIASVLGIGFGASAAVFWVVVVMKTIDQSVRYTVDKTSSVTLYAPLPAAQRNQVQTALESVIEPLVGGVSGLLLALFVQYLGFGSVAVVTIVLVVTATWVALVIVQDRYYQKALRNALRARRMGAGQLTVEDPEAIAVIVESLDSADVGQVLNGLSLVERIDGFELAATYRRLIDHEAPEIRREVLRRIEALGAESGLAPLVAQRVAAESTPVLKGQALRTLATLDPDGAIDHLEPYLSATDDAVRREAFVGLLRHGGIEGILCAGEPLLAALRSPDAVERRFAASVLEGTQSPGFARALTKLLGDAEAPVRVAALRAVGTANSATMWPRATGLLADRVDEVSRTAAAILAQAGDAAIAPLAELISDAAARTETRCLAARVLGEIGSDAARDALISRLELPDRKVAEAVLFAIPMRDHATDTAVTQRFMTTLGGVLKNAAIATAWRATLESSPLAGVEPVLHRALGDQIEDDLRSIFRLLTLIYPEAGLGDTWHNYRFGDPARKAVAMEALEVALRNEYRAPILALIESETDAARLAALPVAIRPAPIAVERIPAHVAEQPATVVAPWTRLAAAYSATTLGAGTLRPSAGSPLLDDPFCQELFEPRPSGGDVLTIEKVLVLRNTPIFAAVREDHLVFVAQHAEPVELPQDTVLFEQGDLGNSMFVVVDGRLRIYTGERTLAEIGAREVVGEMAAVDPEARSASVRAVVPTLLLRISHQNLQLLMDHDPDVARGIIKVLCTRLRNVSPKPSAPAATK
jgi:HEAT repeat protein